MFLLQEAFYPLLRTVDAYMRANPRLVFVMTYQERRYCTVLYCFVVLIILSSGRCPHEYFYA